MERFNLCTAILVAFSTLFVQSRGLDMNLHGVAPIGSTATKEFFATDNASIADYLRAEFNCGQMGYRPASIETEEELALLDAWFLATTGEYQGVSFWTSGSQGLGGSSCGVEWSNGSPITLPLTSGCYPYCGSPSYLWYKCVTVQRTCFSYSAGDPCTWEGGHRYTTQLIWSECMTEKQFLCERTL